MNPAFRRPPASSVPAVNSGDASKQAAESVLLEELVRQLEEADDTAFPPSEDKSGVTGGGE